VSYERQPPALTILTLLEVPATGGDTAWVSQVAAYDRLSDPIKKLLEGLTAEHDGTPQADGARRDGKFVRREPVKNEHPMVRVHPVSTCVVKSRVWLSGPVGHRTESSMGQPWLHEAYCRLEGRGV
jgi:alpha-ketoglutarate-dependent taurine dioxygenase